MKFTYNWLLDHLDTTATPAEIAEKLTALGLEVDEFTDLGKKYEPFMVAEIVEATQHPNADRLRVCKVNNGTETLQIVCGAPNARAGIKVVLAPIGANIPNGNFQIKKSKIRDVESNGMMCSATELELGNDSEGIIELAADAPVGKKYAGYAGLNDSFYEINITPNRADCLGVRGIARDLAAAGLGTLKPLETSLPVAYEASKISVKSDSYYIGCYISNVTNTQSPEVVKQRLKAIGQQPISALVDITNYITFDLGRPLHVYDADKLKGNLTVREAKKGETFNALNNKSYEMQGGELVIADDSGIVALAGIIGGVETSVTDETKNVFLEVAYFDPADISTSGRRHLIDSDARYRFERGVDPEFLVKGAEVAVEAIVKLCGGTPSLLTESGTKPEYSRQISFDFGKTKSFGGIEISQADAETILKNLGFAVSGNQITPPSWRGDVEGSADIIEEILRVYGYDRVPVQELPFKQAAKLPIPLENRNLARNALTSRGLMEVVTYSFMKPEIAAKFGGGKDALKLLNPISSELSEMRPTIIANLIEAAARNANRGFKNAALFEAGPVFGDKEQLVIGGIRSGKNNERNIYDDHRNVDAFDAKADLLAALSAANAPEGRIMPEAPAYYHPGRSGGVYLGKNCLGLFGELHPKLLKELDIQGPVVAFEVFLGNIPASVKKYKKLEVSDFQNVTRDFAFVIPAEANADDLVAAIRKADQLIDKVTIFDVYTGDKVESGKKSVALSVNIQPKDKTLNDSEIEGISKKVTDAISQKFGASLRS